MKTRTRFAVVPLLVCMHAVVVDAQTVDEVIVVTSDPLSPFDAHLARPAQVLSKDDLLNSDSRSIGETVAGSLGVSSADFGPSVGRPVIRGLSGARVRVLEDGIGTMDVSTISQDHAVAAEPVFAEQIEIFRGPATLLYGSGASGGFVNIVDERIPSALPDGIEGELYGQYDSVSDGWLGAVKLDGGLGASLAVHFDAMQRDTRDYDIPGFSEIDPDEDASFGTLENSDVDTEHYTGGISWVSDRGFAGLSISDLSNNYGVPGHHHHEMEGLEQEEEEHHEAGVRIDQGQTRFDLKAGIDDPLPGFRMARARFGYNDHVHLELEGEGEIGTRLDNEEWEGRFELVHAPLGTWDWDGVIGVQLQNRDFTSSGEEAFVPATEQDAFAIFLFEKADIDSLHLDLGLRYERSESRSSEAKANFDVFSLSGGAGFQFHAGHEVGLAVTRAERAPSLEELFSNGPHLATNSFEIGNADIRRESSTNFDVYWRRNEGALTFTVNVFYNLVDNFIHLSENDLNNDGVADRVEPDYLESGEIVLHEEDLLLVNHAQADAEFWGFEAEVAMPLFDDERGRLNGRLWTDYVRGQLDGDRNLPRITPMRMGFDVEYAVHDLDLGLNFMHVFEQDDVANLESPTAGYSTLSAHLGYSHALSPDVSLRVFLRGQNLLDEEIRRHTSFLKDVAPQPGRSVVAGVRVTF